MKRVSEGNAVTTKAGQTGVVDLVVQKAAQMKKVVIVVKEVKEK